MTKQLTIYGRRLDSQHSPTRDSVLTIRHLGQWPEQGIDYEDQARKLLGFLAIHVAGGTMQALEWASTRDMELELQRLRDENAKLLACCEELTRVAVARL